MNSLEIIVKKDDRKYLLDVYDDVDLSITFSLSDLKTFGFKNLNATNTFTLPSTPRNNEYFEHVYNLNLVGNFDPNIKNSCQIKVNNLTVLNGYFELKEINRIDDKYEYCIDAYDGLSDLQSIYQDQLLFGNDDYTDDLLLSGGHTVSQTTIFNSINATQSTYEYSYVFGAVNDYNRFSFDPTIVKHPSTSSVLYSAYDKYYRSVQDVRVGIYYYNILDKLITDAGYTWEFAQEDWLKKSLVIDREINEDKIKTYGFTQRVQTVVNTNYTSNHIHNSRETTNGIILFDMRDQSIPLNNLYRNPSVIISASRSLYSNQNASGDTDYLIQDLSNLKKQTYWAQTGTTNIDYISPTSDWHFAPFNVQFLDNSNFSETYIGTVSSYQNLEGVNKTSEDKEDRNGNNSFIYTASEDTTVSFEVSGNVRMLCDAPLPPPGVPAMRMEFHLLHERQKPDGTRIVDILDTATSLTVATMSNATSNSTTTDNGTYSIRSYYVTLKEGDRVWVGFNSNGNAFETALRYVSTNGVVPVPDVNGHYFDFVFSNTSFKTFTRPSPYGLMSFNADQTIRLKSQITVSGLPSSGVHKIVLCDVGDNGQYWTGLITGSKRIFEYAISNGTTVTIDETFEVEKGFNRYAYMIVFDPMYEGTNMTGYNVTVNNGSYLWVWAVAGLSNVFYNNSVFLPMMKKIDFIKQFTKQFNVFTEFDFNNPKHIIFKTYDDYFINSVKKDWTKYLDADADVTITFGNEHMSNNYTFKYLNDGDDLNESYLKINNVEYGSNTMVNDQLNAFIDDDKEIELLYAPTLYKKLDYSKESSSTKSGITLPFFKEMEEPRLLFKGGTISINATPQLFDKKLKSYVAGATMSYINYNIDKTIYTTSYYPEVGHYDDYNSAYPKNLNFGTVSNKYLDVKVTNQSNNLSQFYQTQFDLFKSTKLITANFILSEHEIKDINYHDTIYITINNIEYRCRLNSIIDWDVVNAPSSTTVELLTF